MAYVRKTRDVWVDDLTAELSRKEIAQRKREYAENMPEGSYRVKKTREPIPATA